MRSLAMTTLDALPEHICLVDDQGTIQLVNRAWRAFATANGAAPDEDFCGRSYLEVCDAATGMFAEGARDFHDGLADVLAGKRAQLSLEYPCDAPHQARWFRATAARYEGPDGRLHVAVSHADITARRAAEDRLQEHAQLLSSFMRHSPICAYIKEVSPTESRVVHASENLKDITGLPSASMVGKPMTQLFPPELAASMTAADWQVASGGQVLRVEEELAGRQYASVKFPLGPNLMGGYTVDVTDQRALEAQRQQSHKAASLGVMAAGIAPPVQQPADHHSGRTSSKRGRRPRLTSRRCWPKPKTPAGGQPPSAAACSATWARVRTTPSRERWVTRVTALLPLLRASMPATVALEVETSSAGPPARSTRRPFGGCWSTW
jgi:PAS domain-containing protein